MLGDGGEILGVGQTVGGGVGLSFGFVTDDDVTVGKNLLKLSAEELGDEGSGEVEGECLNIGERLLISRETKGEVNRRTLPAAADFWLSSSTDSVPCVKK